MLENISKFGKVLSKNEQSLIQGACNSGGGYTVDCEYFCSLAGIGGGVLAIETTCECD